MHENQQTRMIRGRVKGAKISGYADDFWTCPGVADVIERFCGSTTM